MLAVSTIADGTMANRHNPTDPVKQANREYWLASLHISVDHTTLVQMAYDRPDYCRYRTVGPAEYGAGMRGDTTETADALVTTTPGQALFLPLADCIGAVLYDAVHGVLMLSHLGRHNLEQHGALRSVEYLQQHFTTDPSALRVWLSPAVGKGSYQIFSLDNKGLKEAAHEQLAIAGVPAKAITDYDFDTAAHPDYFSHSQFLKGEGPDGRFAVVAMMQPPRLRS